MTKNRIKKVLLTQPNYLWFNGRAWKMHPYSLGILNACIKDFYKTELLDPTFEDLTGKEVVTYLKKSAPDVICISTISTESIKNVEYMTSIIKKNLPDTIIIIGGVLPTLVLDIAMKDKNVDYWIIGEGEFRLLNLLNELNKPTPDLSSIDGLAYYKDGVPKINPPKGYIEDLDSIPFADYGNIDFMDYSNRLIKYSLQLVPRKFPYAVTMTSRGCPYRCVFCSGPKYSGRKVRMRSAKNVLKEIDELYKKGIREIVFLDDHFLFDRKRAIAIMEGLIKRNYDLFWKCCNLTIFRLDEELLDMMKKSGCYQITVSIESGNQYVVNNIIKKPIDLKKVPGILDMTKKKGFEVIANFVIGFPHETWEQIRDSISFAEKLNVDLVNFHIATPLPKTELMDICINEGYLPKDFIANLDKLGYSQGVISTKEFTPQELQILRAFEWDWINFSSKERKKTIARMQGITMDELEQWRKETRRNLGVVNKL